PVQYIAARDYQLGLLRRLRTSVCCVHTSQSVRCFEISAGCRLAASGGPHARRLTSAFDDRSMDYLAQVVTGSVTSATEVRKRGIHKSPVMNWASPEPKL